MPQNLDTFVLQIRNPKTHHVTGTGFVVSIEGLVATCWHVIGRAGIDPAVEGSRVGVRLPGEMENYSAIVVAGLESDDVSILQLEQVLPFGWSSAVLGPTELIEGHSFRTKGYSVLDRYTGVRAEGRILGHLEVENEPPLQFPPIQLSSQQIDQGMSGAPILDLDIDRVVGMTSAIWVPSQGFRQRDTAFAVCAESLIACDSRLSLKPRAEPQPGGLVALMEDISQLLRLKGYRILDKLESETGLMFKCESFEEGDIVPVLVNVVEGDVTPADEERIRQLLIAAGIDRGVILGTSGGQNDNIN